MQIFTMNQYSPEWWQIRCGLPTASEFSRIITAKKGELSQGQNGYIAQLLADRASLTAPFFTQRGGHTAAMRNGENCEPEARRWYDMAFDCSVRQVGFIKTDDCRFGCSPDGLVGHAQSSEFFRAEGGLELKCPELQTHMTWLLKGGLPLTHKAQVHGCLVVTGLKWWDFVSYAPGADPIRIRVVPDEYTAKIKEALETFWDDYNAKSLEHLKEPAPGERILQEVFDAAMATIKAWLGKVETPEDLNGGFEAMAGMKKPIKAAAWSLIKEFAGARGWIYDAVAKNFQAPVPAAAVPF